MYKNMRVLLTIVSIIALTVASLTINGNATAQVADPRVELSFGGPGSVTVGEQFDVHVNIDTPGLTSSQKVSAADLKILFPPTTFRVISITQGTYLPAVLRTGTFNNTTGEASFAYGSGFEASPIGPGILATIRFEALTTGSGQLQFGTAPGVAATGESGDVADNKYSSTITVNETAVPTLSLTSAQSVFVVGQTVTVDLSADTNGDDIDGIDAHLTFDPAVLEVASVVEAEGTPFFSYPALDHDNTAGTIDISANIGTSPTSPAVNGSAIPVARIVFNAISNGSTGVAFEFAQGATNDSNMVKSTTTGDGTDILGAVEDITFNVTNPTPTPTATPTATPTNTPTPTPTAPVQQNMTVKIQLEGRSEPGKSNAANNVTITAKSTTDGSMQSFSNLTTDTNGNTSINILPGNYELLVNVPTYLAKKYPVEVIAGSSSVLDLSGTPLRAGDFNDDTVVNEVDYTLHYLTTIFTNSSLTDINGDGTVNSIDFSIMRRNWNYVDDIL